MICIKDKKLCCGCMACGQACPKQCISLNGDEEGFWYPYVDAELCIDCGLCEKVCPVLHPFQSNRPLSTLAAVNPNEAIRANSSSGGVFTLLAEEVVSRGGVVFGAAYDSDWMVSITSAQTIGELDKFRGSKYLQAKVGNTYRDCKAFLDTGIYVLFSGTPCQISGLKHYLRKDYDNLITVDIVCHGVPSPGVWKQYLAEVSDAGKRAIRDVKFRDKRDGWRKFNFVIDYSEGSEEYVMASEHDKNPYMRAFLSDLILRPSCYECPAKCGRGSADITLADFWGAEHFIQDDDKGVSLVMLNTNKGTRLFQSCSILPTSVDYDEVSKYNSAIFNSCSPHPKRAEFFASFVKGDGVNDLIVHLLKPSYRQQIRQLRSTVKMLIKRVLHPVGGVKIG
ncbi:MAG: Coenzyme F420 hydrogenase/dehydrogenase, beta subunit C-terminal domain [Bacteroidaceae bacterium]|nr:Coenzyme F420 hydrogenase/dehydrogenase, beta subunit C-terminal domain [Bacteroidaceae bacterium]